MCHLCKYRASTVAATSFATSSSVRDPTLRWSRWQPAQPWGGGRPTQPRAGGGTPAGVGCPEPGWGEAGSGHRRLATNGGPATEHSSGGPGWWWAGGGESRRQQGLAKGKKIPGVIPPDKVRPPPRRPVGLYLHFSCSASMHMHMHANMQLPMPHASCRAGGRVEVLCSPSHLSDRRRGRAAAGGVFSQASKTLHWGVPANALAELFTIS